MSHLALTHDDFVSNPAARVPVILCLDVSGSMTGPPIAELQLGLMQFIREVLADELAASAVDLSVVTFGQRVQQDIPFGTLNEFMTLALSASGCTPMGEAVTHSLTLLEERKSTYQRMGIDYYQPWLVIMTDGEPTDSIQAAAARCRELAATRKLAVFPIGIGPAANLQTLAEFSPNRPPLRLQGLQFSKFFQWLSASMSRVSASTPGTTVPLDVAAIAGWAEL